LEARMSVDDTSVSTTRIILGQGEQALSEGTGFLYGRPLAAEGDRTVVFLITAYHMLAGIRAMYRPLA